MTLWPFSSRRQPSAKETRAIDRQSRDEISPRSGHRSAVSATLIRGEAEAAAGSLPALLAEARRLAQTISTGLHGRRQAGPGETFWQHRPYAFGDPVSTIDWRQSARSADRYYVRQFEWESSAPVWIWRDPSASLDWQSSSKVPLKSQRTDVLVTALAILLSEAGERIALFPNADGTPARFFHGRRAPERVLEALLMPSVSTGKDKAASIKPDAPAIIPDVRVGAMAILVSDYLFPTKTLRTMLSALTGRGARCVLARIVDPAEEDFPFEGRVEFEDIETPDRLILGAADRAQSDYRRAFAAHRDGLQATAQSFGAPLIHHRTDMPASQALLGLYGAIAGTKALQ
ncbi:MAG: DUF58 domain-containing protein [Pseudomonadota bacterium]